MCIDLRDENLCLRIENKKSIIFNGVQVQPVFVSWLPHNPNI